jgi:hypothetical protein
MKSGLPANLQMSYATPCSFEVVFAFEKKRMKSPSYLFHPTPPYPPSAGFSLSLQGIA